MGKGVPLTCLFCFVYNNNNNNNNNNSNNNKEPKINDINNAETKSWLFSNTASVGWQVENKEEFPIIAEYISMEE